MKVKGRIIISRNQSNRTPSEFMSICVEDEDARTRAFTVTLSLERFMRALTSTSSECEIETYDLDLLGTVGENKTERIPVFDGSLYHMTDEEREALVAPYRVDGWHERPGDIKNSHNYGATSPGGDKDIQHFCNVVFYRNRPKAMYDLDRMNDDGAPLT